MAVLFYYKEKNPLHYNILVCNQTGNSYYLHIHFTTTTKIITNTKSPRKPFFFPPSPKMLCFPIVQNVQCPLQNLKWHHHVERSPLTTSPTNIKLETPVPFCYNLFPCHLPILVVLHSQHSDLTMGWKICKTSISSPKYPHNLHGPHILLFNLYHGLYS